MAGAMILGIYGYQDAGKTKLVEDLVRSLVRKGYRVASVKHSPHSKSIDCEGKDTWRHGKAGSDPVVFSSKVETALIKHSETSATDIARLLDAEYDPDVIIMEGFKEGAFPKAAIGKVATRKGTALVNPSLKELVSYVEREVAVDRMLEELPGLDCGKCGLDCRMLASAIVDGKRWLRDCVELPTVGVEILIGGKRVPAGKFVSRMVDSTVKGMVSSLKGYEPGKEVEIRLAAKRKEPRKRTKR